MTTLQILAMAAMALGIYVAGHYHGTIISKAAAARATIEGLAKSAENKALSIEETLAEDAAAMLAKLGDKTPHLRAKAAADEAMARQDRLMAELRAKFPVA